MAQMVPVVMFVALFMMMNASWAVSSSSEGFRMDLTHTHSQDKFAPLQLHIRAIQQSKQRMATLTASKSRSSNSTTNGLQSRVSYANSMYLMTLDIGTPPVSVMASIETAIDLSWTQCVPCHQCPTEPGSSLYDPSKSSSFSKIHCNTSLCQLLYQPTCTPDCMYSGYYGSDGYTQGVLSTETLTFKTVDGQDALIPNIAFGCSYVNQGIDNYGVVGLSRAPLSLVSQLGAGKFSYCLTSYGDSMTSPFFFGSSANLNDSSTISLLSSPYPFYFLPLQGITVGATLLPIPKEAFETDEDGFGKFMVDISIPYGVLGEVAFQLVKNEFAALLKLPVVDPLITNDELCFLLPSNSSVEVPKLIFHFQGRDLELPVENYMLHDPSTGFLCFTMLKSTGYFSFGSFQQQNMHVVFDLVQEKVSISPTQCDRL